VLGGATGACDDPGWPASWMGVLLPGHAHGYAQDVEDTHMVENGLDGAGAGDGSDLAFDFDVEPSDVPLHGAQPTFSDHHPPTRMAQDDARLDDKRLGDARRRGAPPLAEGELRYGQARVRVAGRVLRLIAWLAAHQERINQSASESGQLWLTWKGDGPQSISGDIRTRL